MSDFAYKPVHHEVHLDGKISIRVKPQAKRDAWVQKIIDEQIKLGNGAPQALRYQCRIAQDTMEALKAELPAPLKLNPRSTPQFGETYTGLPYLSFGLINEETEQRFNIRWEGDNVPRKMVEVAVKHDQGRATRAAVVKLDFSKAKVFEVTQKEYKRDSRTSHSHPKQRSQARNYARCSINSLD